MQLNIKLYDPKYLSFTQVLYASMKRILFKDIDDLDKLENFNIFLDKQEYKTIHKNKGYFNRKVIYKYY